MVMVMVMATVNPAPAGQELGVHREDVYQHSLRPQDKTGPGFAAMVWPCPQPLAEDRA